MHSVPFCHRTMSLLVLPASQQPGQDLGQTVPYSILHSVMAALASPLVGPVADARLTAVLPLDLQLLKTDADFILGQNTGIYRHCPLCSSVRSTKGVGTSQLLSLDNRLGKPEHALPNRHNASCGPRVLFRLLKDVIWLSWHNRAVLLQLLPLCRHKRLSDPAVCQLRDTQWWEVNSEKKETEQLVCFCWFSLLNSGVRQVPALTQWRGWSRSRKFSIIWHNGEDGQGAENSVLCICRQYCNEQLKNIFRSLALACNSEGTGLQKHGEFWLLLAIIEVRILQWIALYFRQLAAKGSWSWQTDKQRQKWSQHVCSDYFRTLLSQVNPRTAVCSSIRELISLKTKNPFFSLRPSSFRC